MAIRFYLSANAETVPISPTPDSGWENTTILQRVLCETSKRLLPTTTVSFSDSNSASRDILFRQYISPKLIAGQNLIFEVDTNVQVKVACNVILIGSGEEMLLTVGVRIIASNGSTIRKTILNVTRDDVFAVNTSFQDRALLADALLGNYTTQEGDRLVIEIGMGGDPPG